MENTAMIEHSTPFVLIPGLLCSARLYGNQVPELWHFGPVMIADHTRGDTIGDIARHILSTAPPRFALAGLSMGGYIAFEIMRKAPQRVTRLVLLDTSARKDTREQTDRRHALIELAEHEDMENLAKRLFPFLVHRSRSSDEALLGVVSMMAKETGRELFIRHQKAIMNRRDSRDCLGDIDCKTLVIAGEADELTPPEHSKEIADGISGAQLVIVEDCGHLSTIERPLIITQTLTNWLRS